MDTPSELLFVIVGTAVITAFIVAILLRNVTHYRAPDVIYVPSPHQSEDTGSGCLAILILLGLLLAVLFLFSGQPA